MEWILKSPQIHSAFASLGYTRGDIYHVNENCSSTLEEILRNILSEDKCLRTYRRTVSFGQNIPKDLIPLLIHSKDEHMIGLLIKILMNLTIPVECLLALDITTKTDFGRHTIFELRNLLSACKNSFADPRVTKTIIDHLKKNTENQHQSKLSMTQCENIHDSLTLLRNVLHISDDISHRHHIRDHSSPVHNQILWNLFSQGLDKLVIKFMTVPEASHWSATMVQLVALLYKDQHVGKLQKLLNVWLETSLSESSEDNESNTSPQNRGSSTTSPVLTTDQTTSDSSDNCAKINNENDGEKDEGDNIAGTKKSTSDTTEPPSDNSMDTSEEDSKNSAINETDIPKKSTYEPVTENVTMKTLDPVKEELSEDKEIKEEDNMNEESTKADLNSSKKRSIEELDVNTDKNAQKICSPPPTKMCKTQKKLPSETSDCGYGTQIETRESNSTSSNEDDRVTTKPVHMKPRNPKQKVNTKLRMNNSTTCLEDKRRKKMVKRGKSNILNVKGLQFHQPTDDEIALVLKEFTVDFMLKGYRSLVKTLHKQILNYNEIEIDRCHFFWLVTYFLKFATQMELDWEHLESILSFDVVSFLTAEGVNLCEQFELAVKYNKADLNVWRRKLHLVVTAIREFVQAIDTFKRIWSPSFEADDPLIRLQIYMWETDELRSLMVLLIRNYNSDYHDKQYLQDLVVTNHLLLLFLDNVIKIPGYTTKLTMIDHLRQFATPHMMWQYGVLLEDYETNGEFVNDCVFTIMHHVGGDVDSLQSLYRANILHAFSSIKQSDYEICDHWTDLVEYVMNTFARQSSSDLDIGSRVIPYHHSGFGFSKIPIASDTSSTSNGWNDDELSALGWNYMQSKNSDDVIGNVVKLYKDEGILKSRSSVINELYQQNLIDQEQRDSFFNNENPEPVVDDVRKICEELIQQNFGDALEWLQCVLLEVCYVKICLAKTAAESMNTEIGANERPSAQMMCNKFHHVVSPVVYHNIISNKTISLVPWNCRQAAVCKDPKFIQLLAKLNFYMPVDSGMMFFRIPQLWTTDVLYEKALKISNIDTGKLKFSISDVSRDSAVALNAACMLGSVTDPSLEVSRKMPVLPIPEHCYRIQRFKQIGSMIQYTPTPDPLVDLENADQPINNPSTVDWLNLIKRAQETKMPVLSTSFEKSAPMCAFLEPVVTEPCASGCAGAAAGSTAGAGRVEPAAGKGEARGPEDAGEGGSGGKQRLLERHEPDLPVYEEDSTCDTESVASDFSRMYVSDEDERAELPDEPLICFHDLICEEQLPYLPLHRPARLPAPLPFLRPESDHEELMLPPSLPTPGPRHAPAPK